MTRRALTQIGGPVESWLDDAELAKLLVNALRVESDEQAVMRHVHGFHSYPARMHPDTAARLVSGLARPGQIVLDPFSGSGTVLVEARLGGRRGFGVDANPLAVALSRLKLDGLTLSQRERFESAISTTTEFAEHRRQTKAGPTRRYRMSERQPFDPHVLLELDGLVAGIEQTAPPDLGPVLMLVVSALVTKVSRRRSDTSGVAVDKRLASGFVIRFFAKKARELLTRLDTYESMLPRDRQKALVELGDARRLPLADSSVHAIVTSPPYPGVYDYVEHHRLRLQWLKLDIKHLEDHEIGAHRHFASRDPAKPEAEWSRQLGACFDEMARVLVPGGMAALLIADTAVAGRPWFADQALRELAPRHGLQVIGGVSQRRGHFHLPTLRAFRAAPRREHLILLGHALPAVGRPSVETGRKARQHDGHGRDPVLGRSGERHRYDEKRKPTHRRS